MFICRLRLLPRLPPSPSFCSHVIITQRFSTRAATPSQQCLAVSTFDAAPSSQTPILDSPPSTDHLQYLGDNHPSWSDQDTVTDRKRIFPINQEETEKKVDSDPLPALCKLYARLNTRFSKLPTHLSTEQVRSVALRAQKERCTTALDNLTRNILESPEPVRTELARTLLSIPHLRLNPSLTASLLSCTVPDILSSLSLNASSRIACTLMRHPSPSSTETLLACLAKNVAEALKLHQRRKHTLTNWERTTLIWSLFRLVMHLSELSMREPAMHLLQSLIETSYIPPEAIHRADHSSGDFHLIVTLTLVRSCIYWNWNRKALVLTKNYLSEVSSVGPAIARLCQDVLYTLMEFPTIEDLALSLSLVKDMVSSPEPLAVSPNIVRQMYANAQHLGRPHIATSLFMLSQSQAAKALDEFPLPSGPALTWFLRHLSRRTTHVHLTRRLAEQVVDRCERIPLADRAEFISIAAGSGFASHARSLWLRYSSGSEGRIVAGNAAMVVRMCSLFASLRRIKVVNKSGNSQLAAKTTYSPIDDGLDRTLEEEGKDLGNFANLVLTRFREAKEPLQQASREDLNALARANIILGHVKEGLEVLRVTIGRNERPDLHDVNVVLSAIAEVDPRTALKMVRHMAALGPGPDGVSFGTVMHQAARHRDVAVITSLLRLAKETSQQLTTKTVSAVIRASVVLSGTDKDAVHDNLTRALEIIIANEHSSHLATSNMGKFCIEEALNADDPTLAFQFWKRLLRTRAEWDDDLHASLRRRIAKSIHTHRKEGHIRAGDGQKMVSALRRPSHRKEDVSNCAWHGL